MTDINGVEVNVGDTIELVVDHPDNNIYLKAGDKGTVYAILDDFYYLCKVNFHKNIGGSGGYKDRFICPPEYSWNLRHDWFVVAVENEDDGENIDLDLDIESFVGLI